MKEKIKIMLSGDGEIIKQAARTLLADGRFELLPYGLADKRKEIVVEGHYILFIDDGYDSALRLAKQEQGQFLVADFSDQEKVSRQVELFCRFRLPFVATIPDRNRNRLNDVATSANVPGVIIDERQTEVPPKIIAALLFLHETAKAGSAGCFSMLDVLATD